jgi:hypothetical protein
VEATDTPSRGGLKDLHPSLDLRGVWRILERPEHAAIRDAMTGMGQGEPDSFAPFKRWVVDAVRAITPRRRVRVTAPGRTTSLEG